MNFVRSVLEHHRRGGDCDQIETEYKRLEASIETATPLSEATPTSSVPNPNGSNNNNACIDLTTPPEVGASSRTRDTIDNIRNRSGSGPFNQNENERLPNRSQLPQHQQPQRSGQSGGLTTDQLARIEANRQKALRRRAELLAKK
jgi:hypothetical protein